MPFSAKYIPKIEAKELSKGDLVSFLDKRTNVHIIVYAIITKVGATSSELAVLYSESSYFTRGTHTDIFNQHITVLNGSLTLEQVLD